MRVGRIGMMLGSLSTLAMMGAPVFSTYEHGRTPQRPASRLPYPDKPPTNGTREVARRLRQIAAGQLRVSA